MSNTKEKVNQAFEFLDARNKVVEEFSGHNGKYYQDWNLIMFAAKALHRFQEAVKETRLKKEFANQLLFLDDAVISYEIGEAFNMLYMVVEFYNKNIRK